MSATKPLTNQLDALRHRVRALEAERDRLALDLARARDRIARLTRERDAQQRAHADAAALAAQRAAQLDAVGDHITARLAACLAASADDPGRRHLATAVRQVRAVHDTYTAIRGSTE